MDLRLRIAFTDFGCLCHILQPPRGTASHPVLSDSVFIHLEPAEGVFYGGSISKFRTGILEIQLPFQIRTASILQESEQETKVSEGVLAVKERALSRPWLLLHIQKPGHNKYGTSHCTRDHESLVEVLNKDLLLFPLTHRLHPEVCSDACPRNFEAKTQGFNSSN